MRRPLFHLNHYPINSYHPTKAVSRLQRVSNRPRRFACCPTVFRGRSAGPGGAPPTRPVWAIRLESRQGHPARGPLPLLLTSPAVTAVPQWAACTALRCGTAQCGTLVWNTAQGDSNQNAGGPGDPSSPRRSHPGSIGIGSARRWGPESQKGGKTSRVPRRVGSRFPILASVILPTFSSLVA